MTTKSIIIRCNNLYKSFQENKIYAEVIKGINFEIAKGEKVAIVGVSGSGKSTLLHLLGGLDKPSRGSIIINGEDIAALSEKKRAALRNKALGFVYQLHHLLPEFSAEENVAMPLLIAGKSFQQAKEKAGYILEKVGLQHRLQHRPGELSGGERQRTALARALVNDPLCVLADEPTGNLDHNTAAQIYELIVEINETLGTSFLIVTHDHHLAHKMERIAKLEDGLLSITTNNS